MKVMLVGSFSNLIFATIEQNGIRLVFAFGQIGLNIFFRISDVFAARILKKYKDFFLLQYYYVCTLKFIVRNCTKRSYVNNL